MAVPWGGAGKGRGIPPCLPPHFISLCASSSPYSFLSLSPSVSGSLPAFLCFCYTSLRSLPLPAPAWHCGAGDVTRTDSLPAAPASRRRVACPRSRTSNPSVRAAGTPPPPLPPSANPPIVPSPTALPPAPPPCLCLPEGREPLAPAVTLSGVAAAAALRAAAPAACPCPAGLGTCSVCAARRPRAGGSAPRYSRRRCCHVLSSDTPHQGSYPPLLRK